MSSQKIICELCGSEIVPQYSKAYGGNRGRCSRCGVDFPLD